MGCFFGIIGVAIIWPASGYLLLGTLGWLGSGAQQKINNLIMKPNHWLEKKIPFLKFKNSKPISNNFGNIIENIFIKFPLRIIVTLPITLAITAVFLAISFYSVIGAGSCF
jgi:hypothetical protein